MTTEPAGRVLLVADTASKRYVLANWLRRGGFEVVESATGAAATDVFRRGGLALVVLDVRLPDRTGYEVCEEMKADPRYGNTPVIHVLAAATQPPTESVDRTKGPERGADAYLVEPIDPDEMLATIASVLRYYQARLHAEQLAARLAIRRPAASATVTVDDGLFTVDLASLGQLREVVSAHARRCGLTGTAAEDLVLIANELATNVIRHGGGSGQMSLWCADGVVYCRVRDEGPGMVDPDRAGAVPADLTASTGRGLWLIRQLSDRLRIDSGPHGTTVTAAVAGATCM